MPLQKFSIEFLWLSVALFVLLIVAALLPLSPQDYWWYLRLGQDILRTHSIPSVEAYSFTRAGAPYFYPSWLAAVIFWKVYNLGGITSTFLLRVAMTAITYGTLFLMVRESGAGTLLAALLTLVAGLAGSNNWTFRPQMFAYPLFVFTLLILIHNERGHSRGLWFLPLLALLWVNLHGSYLLLFMLVGLTLIFTRRSRKAIALALVFSALAALVNPRGLEALLYAKNMLVSPSVQLSTEWRPPVNLGWQMNLFFLWLLAFAALAGLSPRRLSLLEAAWLFGLGWMALSEIRNVIWFLFILSLETAALLSEWDEHYIRIPSEKVNILFNLIVTVALLLMPLALLPGVRSMWWSKSPDAYTSANPIRATTWLASHPDLPGEMFSDLSFSSYLIFALPSRPVWIDTRFELYPVEQWQEYVSIEQTAPGWETILERYKINLLVLSPAGEPSLIQAAQGSHHWCQQYRDEDAVIFSRCVQIQ
jgi:hypothetical protein